MSRVKSKNLFNYQLSGEKAAEVVALEEAMAKASPPEMQALVAQVNSHDPDVPYETVVTYFRAIVPILSKQSDKFFQESVDKCTHTQFKVPIRDGNNAEVSVHVHTPTNLPESGNPHAALIYAHGGGAVAGDASLFKGVLSHLAVESGVVVFNVDYRLAPETRYPYNVLDFYCALKHVCENAASLGVDASRIAIGGESGGGYICFATMVMLAQRGESDLVKLAIPAIPMIDDYCFGDLAAMAQCERESAACIQKLWKCVSNDLQRERSNPLLFPAKASDDIIAKMPPTIIWESEFDSFITEATRMAHRMRVAGRLLEFRMQPGMTHTSTIVPGTQGFKDHVSDYKRALQEYLF